MNASPSTDPPPVLGTRVHWLTISVRTTLEDARKCLLISGDGLVGTEERGRYNHPRHDLTYRGVKIYHGGRPGQPVVIEWDGDACDRTERRVFCAVWEWLTKHHGQPRCTRLDLARDIGGPSLVEDVKRRWMDGAYNGPIWRKSLDWHESLEGGRTCYLGSKTSDLRVCVYDRRGHNRFEFRLRRDNAHDAMLQLVWISMEQAYALALRRFGTIDAPWWDLVNEPGVDETPRPARTLSELQEAVNWFKQQLGPTLWGLAMAGVTMDELAREPERQSAHQRRQQLLWLHDARKEGRTVDEKAAASLQRSARAIEAGEVEAAT